MKINDKIIQKLFIFFEEKSDQNTMQQVVIKYCSILKLCVVDD